MNLGFSKLKSLFDGKAAAATTPLPDFTGTAYGGAAAFGSLPDDNGNIGGLPNYGGEFDSLPSDYGAYSNLAPSGATKKGKFNRKKFKQGAEAAAGQPDITQGMQPAQPFRMTGGLLGGMR